MLEASSDIFNDFLTYLNTLVGLENITLNDIINLNFLESASKFNAEAFATTYQMHKYVTVISDWVKDQPGYFEIEDGEEITSDISGLIYRQFAELIKSTESSYKLAWGEIRQDIDELYEDANLAQPIEPSTENIDILVAQIGRASCRERV